MVKVKVAENLGFCPGVLRAIEKAQAYAEKQGSVYSLGPVAHNEDVVKMLTMHGVHPINESDLIDNTRVIITAHGVGPKTYAKLHFAHCGYEDCTCSIVKRAQDIIEKMVGEGYDIIIFGDKDHPEVKGLYGWSKGQGEHLANGARFIGELQDLFHPGQSVEEEVEVHGVSRLSIVPIALGKKVAIVSQTTQIPGDYADFIGALTYHHLKDHREEFRVFNTICPWVASRLTEAAELAKQVTMMLVVGSASSANTQNLATVCQETLANEIFVVNGPEQALHAVKLFHTKLPKWDINVGVTAGTSTPIEVVNKVVAEVEKFDDK